MNAARRERLELAREEARRRQHATTEPEHLLAVSLGFDAVALAVYARGLDPNELRVRLEEALAAMPSRVGYREMVDPMPSPGLQRSLQRTSRWFRKASLLEALFQEPGVAAVVWQLRHGEDARYVEERSSALAIVRRHRTVGVEHALRALVDLPSFVATLERAGGNAAALSSALDARLKAQTEAPTAPPDVDPSFLRLLASAKFPRTDDDPATIREVSMALARDWSCEPFWTAAGITPSAFLEAVLVPK